MNDQQREAFSNEDIEAIITCLDEDAATLRDENPDDEIASNMQAAASLIEQLRAALTQPQAQQDRRIEVLRAERDHARAVNENLVKALTSIHTLINPLPVEHDGKTYTFVNPHANETLQALSDQIRAIPDKIQEYGLAQQAAAVPAGALAILNAVIEDMEGGFVRCSNCGDQEDTKDLDFMRPLLELRTLLAAPPAPVLPQPSAGLMKALEPLIDAVEGAGTLDIAGSRPDDVVLSSEYGGDLTREQLIKIASEARKVAPLLPLSHDYLTIRVKHEEGSYLVTVDQEPGIAIAHQSLAVCLSDVSPSVQRIRELNGITAHGAGGG